MEKRREIIHFWMLPIIVAVILCGCDSPSILPSSTPIPATLLRNIASNTPLPSATASTQPTAKLLSSATILPSKPSIPTIANTLKETYTPTPEITATLALNSPGHYFLGRCYSEYDHLHEDYIIFCIAFVDVKSDGKMVFSVSLTYQTKPDPNSPTGYRDPVRRVFRDPYVNSQRVYLKDDTGKTYYMSNVAGFPTEYYELMRGKSIYGTFSFEPAVKNATQFTFYENDDNVVIDRIFLKPGPAQSTGLLTSTPSITFSPGPGSQGIYKIGRCLIKKSNLQQVEVCILTVEVRQDGKMAFNVRQTFTDLSIPANSPASQSKVILDRRGFWYSLRAFIKDDLGNTYYLNSAEGIFSKDYRLYHNTPVYGAFIFEPASKNARSFSFYEQDDSLVFESIMLNLRDNP